MDIIEIANEIQNKIDKLESIRKVIRDRGHEKSEAIAWYDKQISVTIIKLKNNQPFHIDGNVIQNPPVTIIEKIAKGICYQEKLDMEKAESLYKSAVVNMEAVLAQLNALQSLFRHLDRG